MTQQINKRIYSKLNEDQQKIAEKLMEYQSIKWPERKEAHGGIGYRGYIKGLYYNLSILAEAVSHDEEILFTSNVCWGKIALGHMGIGIKEMVDSLECLLIVFQQLFSDQEFHVIKPMVEAGLDELKSSSVEIPSYIIKENSYAELAEKYLEFVLKGEKQSATSLIMDAIHQGVGVKSIYLSVFERTQKEIGRMWQLGKISVAQEHYCTALTQMMIAQLYPIAFKQRNDPNGHKFIGTCMSDELHEMGIRMVTDFLEQDGWDTYYLGANMPVKELLKAIDEIEPSIIGLSATMTTSISKVEKMIREIHQSIGHKNVKIVVGGYPFGYTTNLWEKIGADGQSNDAAEAVILCNQLVMEGNG